VRVVFGFVRDAPRAAGGHSDRSRLCRDRSVGGLGGRPEPPIYVIELGAGSGRFAFLFLTALEALERDAGVGPLPIRYVMTDATESNIAFWRRHEALAPFVRAGRLDFARFDAETDGAFRLRHARRTISPRAPVGRLVVVANYVFDSLRHDAFVLRGGRVYEYLAAAALPARGRAADVSLPWRVGARVTAPYGDAAFDTIVRDYATSARTGRVVFPISPLRCLARFAALAQEDMLALVADRGTATAAEATALPVNLKLARHGSISLPVNFHALRTWVTSRGGRAFRPARTPRHLHVAAFVLGARAGGWPSTRAAYDEAIAHGGPDALYHLRHALTDTAERMSASQLLAVIRLSGDDARVMAECIRPLWRHVTHADARRRIEIRDAARAAWANYYHLGEDYDLAFNLGLLLYEARAYVDALALFQESLRLYGDDAATLWNAGLGYVALAKPDEATASFQRARALAPGYGSAGLALVTSHGGTPPASPQAPRRSAPRRSRGAPRVPNTRG